MEFTKHVLPLLMALAMLTTALAGCSSGDDTETKAETKVETSTKAPATETATEPATEPVSATDPVTEPVTEPVRAPATEAKTETGSGSSGSSSALLPPSEGLVFQLDPDSLSYGVSYFDDPAATTIVIPETYNDLPVTCIYSAAFSDAYKVTSVVIPDSVIRIEGNGFAGLEHLKSVVMSSNIKMIGSSAFLECLSLTDIYYDGTQEQWRTVDKTSGWDEYTGSYTVHCTDGDIVK